MIHRGLPLNRSLELSTDSVRGPETMGNNWHQPDNQDRERVARLVGLTADFMRDGFGKPQVSGLISALEELPGHDYPMDLVGALVDVRDRGPAGVLPQFSVPGLPPTALL